MLGCPAQLVKNRACRAMVRPEIGSTRPTYLPPPHSPIRGEEKVLETLGWRKSTCLFPVMLSIHLSADRKNFHHSYQLASPLVGEGRVGGAQEQDRR